MGGGGGVGAGQGVPSNQAARLPLRGNGSAGMEVTANPPIPSPQVPLPTTQTDSVFTHARTLCSLLTQRLIKEEEKEERREEEAEGHGRGVRKKCGCGSGGRVESGGGVGLVAVGNVLVQIANLLTRKVDAGFVK